MMHNINVKLNASCNTFKICLVSFKPYHTEAEALYKKMKFKNQQLIENIYKNEYSTKNNT